MPPVQARQHAAFALLAVVWLISDMRLIRDPRYNKDDYRRAASVALEEAGRTGGDLIWAAEAVGARYYGIDVTGESPEVDWPVRATAVLGRNWTGEQIAAYVASRAKKAEAILALNRPDANDSSGAWAAAVLRMHAHEVASPTGFAIYAFAPGTPSEVEAVSRP